MSRYGGGFQPRRNARHPASTTGNRENQNSDRYSHTEPMQNNSRTNLELNKFRSSHQRRGFNHREGRSPSVDLTKRNFKDHRQYPLGYNALKEILIKEPDDIILELLRENSGYKLLLQDANITPDKVFLLFGVLSKSCKSTLNKENLLELLSVTFCKPFINMLSNFLLKLQSFDEQRIKFFLTNLFEICFLFQDSRPYESINSFEDIINAAILILKDKSKYAKELSKCMELRNKAEETRQSFVDKAGNDEKGAKLLSLKFQRIYLDDMEPPDDFRQISVLPTAADISSDELPFLRRNVIKGKYKDPYHYLDVQFRLLREDFIRPLREGLSHFREQSIKRDKLRSRDLNIYKKIKVDKTELIHSEFIYYIQLNLPRHLKMENSKRLLFGNLLCFSKDNFKTIVFGYVFDRDINNLKKGVIGVKLESKQIDLASTYDMAESRAYFVSYQHVLEALQNIQDCELPLPHYLIDVSNDMHHPYYFNSQLYYDFRVIKDFNLMKKPKTLQFFRSASKEPPIDFFPQLATIRVATPINFWPSADLLSLDETQRVALYGALTRQLAIIQGPPGTGKTFLGLKVTQILLHNTDKWGMDNPGPILVVCYTNHALDQFLEGMVRFTSSIVRVGSRSKSEILSQFQISNLEKITRNLKLLPRPVHNRNAQLYSEINELEEKIAELLGLLKELKDPKGIFSYNTLCQVIPPVFSSVLEEVGIENWVLDIALIRHPYSYLFLDPKATSNPEPSVSSDSKDGKEDSSSINLEQEENEDQDAWDDAKEYIEQEQINRIIDLGVNISCKKNKLPVIMNQFYDTTANGIRQDISCIEYNLKNEIHKNYTKLRDRRDFLSEKLRMLEICLQYKQNIKLSTNFANILDPKLVLRLSIQDRWHYYHSWVEDCLEVTNKLLPTVITAFQRKSKALEEMKSQEHLLIMRNSSVVGMTTTGAAKFSKVIRALSPKIVILEEAAEILESHVLISLSSKCQHLIMIGDHQQLRPTTLHDLAVKYNLDTSLFERMIKNGVSYETLEFQHRMRPSISKLLVPNIYPSLKDDESVHGRDHIKGVTKDIYFIDHQFYEDKAFDDNNSHENSHEAKLIMALCRHLLLQGYEPNKITILTAYSGQFFLLRKIQREDPVCASVKICVVDNFQGEENDIILLSLVRSNPEENVGFLKINNRVCVALSRAKNGFYITGNMNQLSLKCELWKKINQTLTDQDCIGPSIELKCENHPEMITPVSSGQQILKLSPEGGCLLQCSFNFELCGHPCPRTCHVRDMDHEKFKCMKPCLRKLCEKDKHLCVKKCWETCGPCMIPVEKVLPCEHTHTLSCSIDPALYPRPTDAEQDIMDHKKFKCMKPCLIKLCSVDGHICVKKCWEQCGPCMIPVEKVLPCGHKLKLGCSIDPALFQRPTIVERDIMDHKLLKCMEQCLRKLCAIDGHLCAKKCWEQCGSCMIPVEKVLPCGHKHKLACSIDPALYPRPTDAERDIMDHKKFKCMKPCLIKLCLIDGHICAKKCWEKCGPCMIPVEKVLPCGHANFLGCSIDPALFPHPTDVERTTKDHKKFKCKKTCLRKLCAIDEHLCTKKCWEPCGLCMIPVEKALPCGHTHTIECHIDPALYPCPTEVEREIPDCQHVNKMPCHSKVTDCICSYPCDTRLDCGHQCRLQCHRKDDPLHDKYLCQERCSLLNKDCSLNHQCLNRCSEECGLCISLVEKKLPCGHVHRNVRCHEKPEEIECRRPCNKVMACGHPCYQKCYESCGGCEITVEKLVPDCAHIVKMPCGEDPTKRFCGGNCVLKLSCGHICQAKCNEPCNTISCAKLVPSRFRCPQNHQIPVECHTLSKITLIAEQEAELWCKENCNRTLSCGHTCKGKCGDCFNGRLHMPCNAPCGKPLVCGHICKSPCSMDCPPCLDNCEFKCGHSRCRKKCAVPCSPCQEPCLWKCPHKICKEKCGNTCSRDPCTEPCPRILPCRHPCIGFCGDPCPPLCRVCDQDKLTELILSGLEEEDDARFVMLEDCNHVIEVTALEQWLNIKNEEVGIKRCPRCKKGIFNSRRYYKIIKNTYEDVNKVKIKYFDHENSSAIKKQIAVILKLQKLDPKFDNPANIEPQEIEHIWTFYSSECTALLKDSGMDSTVTSNRKKIYISTTEYGIVLFKAKTLKKAASILFDLRENFNKEKYSEIVRKLLEVLVKRVLNIQDKVSSQLGDEVSSELQRIGILPYIFKLQSRKKQNYIVGNLHSQIEQLVNPTKKFDRDLEQKVRNLLKESEQYIGGLGITSSERSMILAAMQLTQGHWYKCPNGHVYCITECGGAMQKSRCPDCGASVGGGSHQLLSDNAVATEMDGATYAAWSEQANLANYDINDFND